MADDGAVAHDEDIVGDGERLVVVVGDVERGRAQGSEDATHLRGEVVAQGAVERPQRLVEHEEIGGRGESPRQGDALLLTTGEAVDGPRLVPGEPDEVEQLPDPAVRLGPGDVGEPEGEGDVGGDVEVGKQGVVLEHQPEGPGVWRRRGDVHPVPRHGALVRALQPRDDAQQGGLAASRWPDETADVADAQLQAGAVDGGRITERDRDVATRQHQNSPRWPTRSRSMARMAPAVMSMRRVLIASARPRF